MGKNNNGIWIEDLLCGEKLSGTEKLWRDIYRIADEFYLLVTAVRYPLTSDVQQYRINVCKIKKGKWFILFEEGGMELEIILRKLKKKLVTYKDEHKEYNLRKPGGGEMI